MASPTSFAAFCAWQEARLSLLAAEADLRALELASLDPEAVSSVCLANLAVARDATQLEATKLRQELSTPSEFGASDPLFLEWRERAHLRQLALAASLDLPLLLTVTTACTASYSMNGTSAGVSAQSTTGSVDDSGVGDSESGAFNDLIFRSGDCITACKRGVDSLGNLRIATNSNIWLTWVTTDGDMMLQRTPSRMDVFKSVATRTGIAADAELIGKVAEGASVKVLESRAYSGKIRARLSYGNRKEGWITAVTEQGARLIQPSDQSDADQPFFFEVKAASKISPTRASTPLDTIRLTNCDVLSGLSDELTPAGRFTRVCLSIPCDRTSDTDQRLLFDAAVLDKRAAAAALICGIRNFIHDSADETNTDETVAGRTDTSKPLQLIIPSQSFQDGELAEIAALVSRRMAPTQSISPQHVDMFDTAVAACLNSSASNSQPPWLSINPLRPALAETESLRLSSIAGNLKSLGQLFEKLVMPLKYPESFPTDPRLLVYGPPKSGKSLALEAAGDDGLANQITLDLSVFACSHEFAPGLVSEVFCLAAQLTPSILILDNLDAVCQGAMERLAPKQVFQSPSDRTASQNPALFGHGFVVNGHAYESSDDAVAAFKLLLTRQARVTCVRDALLAGLAHLEEVSGTVAIVSVSTQPQAVDMELMNKCNPNAASCMFSHPTTTAERTTILKSILAATGAECEAPLMQRLDFVAGKLNNYSCGDIYLLVQGALSLASLPVRIRQKREAITVADFQEAFRMSRPSLQMIRGGRDFNAVALAQQYRALSEQI